MYLELHRYEQNIFINVLFFHDSGPDGQ